MVKDKSLLPADWAVAALQAVAAGGVENVSVERLAKSLGVTKGSFYWHFADRAALIVAAAEEWERLGTTEVIAALDQIADPKDRLRQLLEVSLGDDLMGPTDTALAAKADDPLLGSIVQRVTTTRVGYVESIFVDLGLTPAKAAHRARQTYATYLGHFALKLALSDDPRLTTNRSRYLHELVETLTT